MGREVLGSFIITLAAGAAIAGCAAKPEPDGKIVAALTSVLRNGRGIPLTLAPEEKTRLQRFYQINGTSLVWLNEEGEPRRIGRAALEQLGSVELEGLRPEDYAVARLDSMVKAAQEGETPELVAQADAGISAGMLRLLQHIHVGRVSPRRAGFSIDPPKERHDYVGYLSDGIRQGDIAGVVRALQPGLEQYRLARSALEVRLRQLTDTAGPPVPSDPSLEVQVRQLELALERLRWISDLGNEPFVLVNIPLFELTAWASPYAPGPPRFRTGVIVGKALDTETPVLIEEMRYLIFQPYWNIPASIARGEIIPAIEKDPDYLVKNNMEIVNGQSDQANPVPSSGGAIQDLEEGTLRIRQRPGPGNALGPVKFIFPNDANVYLHGTPAEQLFDRARRDFSHGCVRVEDPTGLAEWVMRENPEWTRDRIEEAMEDGSRANRRVNLPRPLTVILFYSTAFVDPDGTVRFAPDIYGHDARLEAALGGER